MKKVFCILSLLVWSIAAFAQISRIPQRLELVQIEVNDGERNLEVFDMPRDGESHYYLSVGTLGIGDEVVQFHIDPLFELFIPLGDTLDEAMETLGGIQELFKSSPGTSMLVDGCLAAGFPNDKVEPVKVTYRKLLLSRILEFSLEQEGFVRMTQVSRMDFKSLVSSLKMYRKIHPKKP